MYIFLFKLHPNNEVCKMTKKVVTAFSIFTVIFGAAWYLHENTKRMYGQNIINQPTPELINSNIIIPASFESKEVFEPFAPREYIRIMTK